MSPSLMNEGLTLMMAGMGTVFVFLTLLVITMSLMSRLVGRFSIGEAAGPAGAVSPETVAAIAAAIEQHRQRPAR